MFQICFVDYGNQSIYSASESQSLVITFTGSESISASLSRFTTMEIPDTRKRNGKKGGGGGGGGERLFEGVIILNILGRGANVRGRRFIEGRLLFNDIR